MSRRLIALLIVGVGVIASAPTKADAHAVIRSSDPSAGARVERPPPAVTITFTETPEPAFSAIRVLDSTGRPVQRGNAEVVPGMPLAMRVSLPELEKGVYTVSWRAFSRVDGHTTAGSFSFGVGVSPTDVPSGQPEETAPSKTSSQEIVGRWTFDLGLVLLFGTSLAAGAVFTAPPPVTRKLLVTAVVITVAGLAVLANAQRAAAGVGWGQFFEVFIGRAILWRASGLIPAGAALGLAKPGNPTRQRRWLIFAAVGAATAALFHVAAGHAAASQKLPQLQVASQWVHFVAVGVWIGGLAALVAGTKGAPDEAKGAAVRRFSLAAGVALFAVVVTGVFRAVDSLGSWRNLFTTTYGITVTVKSGLWIALAILGAVNRYRNVPAINMRLGGLRTVSKVELSLAALAIGAAAMLASIPPGYSVAATSEPRGLTLSGSDFATSVRVRLEVSPGTAGPNQFDLRLTDYDTGDPVRADSVILRFTSLDDPELGDSTLILDSSAPGRFGASGPNLSSPGRWRVIVLIQQAADSKEVPLQIATRCEAMASTAEGQPTIYTVSFPSGVSAQGYLDPGKAGFNEVHLTLFDPNGQELPAEDATLYAATSDEPRTMLSSRRFGPGHFVADADLRAARYRFDFTSTTGGQQLAGCFESPVAGAGR